MSTGQGAGIEPDSQFDRTGIPAPVSTRFRRRDAPALIKDDVIVWGIDRGGDVASITVAVTQDDLKAVKSLLGISDVFVVQPSVKDTSGTQNDPPEVVGSGRLA